MIMKYCVNSRQPNDILEKADEMFVEARDYKVVPDLFVKYPDKIIILEYKNDVNDAIIKKYSEANPENFVVKLHFLNPEQITFCKENNIKFYYAYPCTTWFEVNSLKDIGVEYILIQEPLTFDIPKLALENQKFRMIPNIAYAAYIPRKDGLHGQWVRPEDVKYYEPGITVFEFEDADLVKERTLFHIYAENGYWPGNLNLLFTNFGIDVDNRLLIEDIGKQRSECKQRCETRGTCHYCDLNIKFHSVLEKHKEEILELKEKRDKKKEEQNPPEDAN